MSLFLPMKNDRGDRGFSLISRPEPIVITHPQSDAEWKAVRDLCCKTGKSGSPVEPERWPFFSEFWIGPYERLRPDWTYIAKLGERVLGYLTGCPDTESFQRERALRIVPSWLLQLALRIQSPTVDTRRFLRRTFRLEKAPEDRFSRRLRDELNGAYPAHLHVNVEKDCRSFGIGAELLRAYKKDLALHGIPGVHLFCGPGPLKFYLRNGFNELDRLRLPSGAEVFALGALTH